ncbi:MAG: carbohydrate kinase [Saprospiraceae bacterium]|nr:carbohydrate kinase [Saprospiraceae bacterium]
MNTLSLGEILWDLIEDIPHIGGAPFNVSAHLNKLGADAYIASSVGQDELGDRAMTDVRSLGIHMNYLTTNDLPTGTVPVVLKNGQPTYTITENVAWDQILLSDEQLNSIQQTSWDCIIFGTLAQRSSHNRALLSTILKATSAREVFYDVNLRQDYYDRQIIEQSLKYATIFKLNDEEVAVLSDLLYGENLNFEAFAQKTIETYQIKAVCITRGADGVLILTTRDQSYDVPGKPVKVADTVGAGDSFSAAFLYTYLKTGDFEMAGKKGCQLGGFVASQNGAIPEYSAEITQLLKVD